MKTLFKTCLIIIPLTFFLASCQNSDVPKGTIIAFYSANGKIPSGWAICDGTNETPDLTGKFLRGASKIGGSGGNENTTIPGGGRKGSDWNWGETPWRNGPNPVIGETTVNILPPYLDVVFIMFKGN